MPSEDKMRKTIKVAEAVARMPDGVRLMIGGFMGVGTPPRLIDEAVRQGKIRDNDIVVLNACGGGLTWGASVVRW